jgi:hypothetical protein
MCDYAYDCRQYGLYTCAVTLVVQTLKSRVTGSQQLVAANIASRPSIAIYAWCTSRSLFFHRKTHSTNLSSPLFQYYILQLSDLALSTYVRTCNTRTVTHTYSNSEFRPTKTDWACVHTFYELRTYIRPAKSFVHVLRTAVVAANEQQSSRSAGRSPAAACS